MKGLLLAVIVAAPAVLMAGCGNAAPTMAGPKWAEALHDRDVRLRRKAAFTLGNIGPSDPAVLPALRQALKDADAGVRTQAILSLVKFGTAAREAVPALGQLQRGDPSAMVRAYAGRAIAALRPGGDL